MSVIDLTEQLNQAYAENEELRKRLQLLELAPLRVDQENIVVSHAEKLIKKFEEAVLLPTTGTFEPTFVRNQLRRLIMRLIRGDIEAIMKDIGEKNAARRGA